MPKPRPKKPSTKITRQRLLDVPKQAVAAAAGAMSVVVASPTPGAALTQLAFATTFALALSGAWDWKQGHGPLLEEGMKSDDDDDGPTGADFEDLIAERTASGSPAFHALILRTVRTLIDVVDDGAILPLARLAREYTLAEKAPDAFFRGVARLLTEVEAGDLKSIERLAVLVATNSEAPRLRMVIAHKSDPGGPLVWSVKTRDLLRDEVMPPAGGELQWGADSPEYELTLLETTGLGRRSNAFGATLDVEVSDMRRLAKLLRPAATSGDS